MARPQSLIRHDHIEFSFFVVFDSEGGVRMTRKRCAMSRDERGMEMTVTIPKAVFATPQLSARITVADPGTEPPTIDVEAASEALRQVVGCDVAIEIRDPASPRQFIEDIMNEGQNG